MNFKELGLSDVFVERLSEQKIGSPTDIQQDIFKPILIGESILGLSKTGTGKTLSYLAPLVERYKQQLLDQENNASASASLCWVLVPTRELAEQVKDTFSLLTKSQTKIVVVVGGESEEKQVDALSQARFVVATPGRLLDLLQRKRISTSEVEVVVMDEADRLLDMGFIDDIRKILSFLQKKPQLICVSATLHFGVEEVAFEMGLDPKRFGVAEAEATVAGLDHRVAYVGNEEKFHALVHFIHERKESRGIVFSNYREAAHGIASRLRGLGYPSDALSAQLSQPARKKIIEDYRASRLKVLVASDLASRGLDFIDIDYVVNFDLPEDPATYVHRVGRTARAGREGRALSLIGFEDSYRIERLEKFLNAKIESEQIPVEKLSGSLSRYSPRPDGQTTEEPYSQPGRSQRSHSPRPQHGGGGYQGNRSQQGGRSQYQGSRPQHSNQDGRPQSSHAKPQHSSAPRPQRSQAAASVTPPVQKVSQKKQSVWGRVVAKFKAALGIKTTAPAADPSHTQKNEARGQQSRSHHSQNRHSNQNRRPQRRHSSQRRPNTNSK